MKRLAVRSLIPALAVGFVGLAQPSQAQTFVGNFCWKLDPFVDTLRATLTVYPDGIIGTFVRWRAGTSYQFQGAGVLSADSSNPGDALLAFNSSGTTANFTCNFQGKLTSGANGTWEFQCPSTGFTNSGTLTLVACPADAAPDREGPTAMQ